MKFLLGVVVGIIGVVLVALAGDPREKRHDSTSLFRQTERFEPDDYNWLGEWPPITSNLARSN